jgi:hypothetical protein
MGWFDHFLCHTLLLFVTLMFLLVRVGRILPTPSESRLRFNRVRVCCVCVSDRLPKSELVHSSAFAKDSCTNWRSPHARANQGNVELFSWVNNGYNFYKVVFSFCVVDVVVYFFEFLLRYLPVNRFLLRRVTLSDSRGCTSQRKLIRDNRFVVSNRKQQSYLHEHIKAMNVYVVT